MVIVISVVSLRELVDLFILHEAVIYDKVAIERRLDISELGPWG